MTYNDVVVIDGERMRALYPASEGVWWFKSLSHPHSRKRKIALSKIGETK